MSAPPSVSWTEVLQLISPDGRRQIREFVSKAAEERGANWLPEIKAEYPTFSWIVDLVANHPAEEAFEELKAEFPKLPLWMFRAQLLEFHGFLKTEIERKR
jgi:hypothetical protein